MSYLTSEQCAALIECAPEDFTKLLAKYYAKNHAGGGAWEDYLPNMDAITQEVVDFGKESYAALHQVVCVDLDACSRQHDANFEDGLAAVLGPVVARWAQNASYVVRWAPLPLLTSLVVIYVMRQGIDRFCGCPSRAR